MKIFITGGSGFVGSNLKKHLSELGHDILAPTRNELDLMNYSEVNTFIQTYKPEIIIHAAGKVGGIQVNMQYPMDFFYTNLEIGKNVVYAASNNNIPKLLNLSSSCIYPANFERAILEEDLLTGNLETTNEGYALAKISVMKFCQYANIQNELLTYKTLIPCNLYGPEDKFDLTTAHMVPSVINKIHNAKKLGLQEVEIWGDGTARREFMYIDDLVDCISFAVKYYDTMPEVLNVGLGTDYSINEYYIKVAEVIGYTGEFKHDLSKPTGMKRKLLDIRKLNAWGWKSQVSLDEGIRKTYNYYRANVEH